MVWGRGCVTDIGIVVGEFFFVPFIGENDNEGCSQ
jgi:hypothetical protein